LQLLLSFDTPARKHHLSLITLEIRAHELRLLVCHRHTQTSIWPTWPDMTRHALRVIFHHRGAETEVSRPLPLELAEDAEAWVPGVVEYWSVGVLTFSITPILQHSVNAFRLRGEYKLYTAPSVFVCQGTGAYGFVNPVGFS
jgi:hypothetical protein